MWIARRLRHSQLDGEEGGQQCRTHSFTVVCKQSLFHLFAATQRIVVSISRDYEKEKENHKINSYYLLERA